ncbi:MAG: MBL fold metallo-hydrolase [Mycobacteriaceae bacterium]
MGTVMSHPAHGQLRQVTPTAAVLLARNGGPMTLEGTNTWILRAPDSGSVIVIDPGPGDNPEDIAHLERVSATAPVELVLITHRHADHTGGIDRFSEFHQVPVRSLDSQFLRCDATELVDGEVIEAAGLHVQVVVTKGHTGDSVSFVLDDAVLTGDTILGYGTTVIDHTDGDLGEYLNSLQILQELGQRRIVLPGHGPELPDVSVVAAGYLEHRKQRLAQVEQALRELGDQASAREVVEYVYKDIDKNLWAAAEWSVTAQLTYLRK